MTSWTPRLVALDIDGTLVDSVYLHVHAWSRAFHQVGLTVPSHRIHGAIGMGGDRIVTHLAGEAAEASIGDSIAPPTSANRPAATGISATL